MERDGIMTANDTLKPCPFCGAAPNIKRVGNEHTKKIAVHIVCPTEGCTIEMRVAALPRMHGHDHDWCEEKAREKWNHRLCVKCKDGSHNNAIDKDRISRGESR